MGVQNIPLFVHRNSLKTWTEKSPYLKNNFKLNKSENTAALLREYVKYRLRPTMQNRTCKNTNTQKAEATNRAIRATVPSNVTFTRNYKGRVQTAIHNVNNGPGESIVKLCKAAGVPIEPGSRATRGLKNIQRHNEKHKLYKQSKRYTDQRCSEKHELYEIYDEYQEEKTMRKTNFYRQNGWPQNILKSIRLPKNWDQDMLKINKLPASDKTIW
ncbi:unnamed protein product [Mytilus coruscus]|uniref:Uncharacterized protein n=1 Tax=Mytilus coruscus TaxID=42192 RepID=A0A6J8ELD6_MYTCO|nr:unnamed protein product [Mytilus coruscus]